MFKKKIDNQADIHELIASRWSGRAYDPGRFLSRTKIISLLEAARW
ncbi:MAG: nitroreductase, partial [Gammaproteobacteria bacterium]